MKIDALLCPAEQNAFAEFLQNLPKSRQVDGDGYKSLITNQQINLDGNDVKNAITEAIVLIQQLQIDLIYAFKAGIYYANDLSEQGA